MRATPAGARRTRHAAWRPAPAARERELRVACETRDRRSRTTERGRMVGTPGAVGSEGENAVRRLIGLVAVVGCAQVGSPPGGPEDRNAPVLLRVSPDTNAVSVRPEDFELRYDEVINERPARGGGELSSLFVVSPRRGRIEVRWRRSRIEIRPRNGWLPNTTYTITQLPGLTDLRGNVDS